jgi:hypothetical protein
MALLIDTLAYARRLRDAGFTEAQAEAQASALAFMLSEEVATKRDLEKLATRESVDELRQEIRQEIQELRHEFRRDLDTGLSSLRLEMGRVEQRLTVRLGLMLAFGLGALGTLQAVL